VLSGVMMAKGLAMGLGKPLIGVNHLAGHALTPRLTDGARFPYLLLLVSGGHCQILRVDDWNAFTRLGGTIDDAPGEAFDKVARLLGLPQPGGPSVEEARNRAIRRGSPSPDRCWTGPGSDMSFSGLKTAVLRARDRLMHDQGGLTERDRADICAGFQAAVADVLAAKTAGALRTRPDVTALAVAGGVAANATLRTRLEAVAAEAGLSLHCAAAGAMHRQRGDDRLCGSPVATRRAKLTSDMGLRRARAGRSTQLRRPWSGRARRAPRHDAAGGLRCGCLRRGACMAYAAAGTGSRYGRGPAPTGLPRRARVPRLPGVRLPDAIRVTQDPKIDADIALIAVPTQSLGAMLTDTAPGAPSLSPAPRASTWPPASGPRR
jgi:glycoprotease/Kae1 family metallohydrolase